MSVKVAVALSVFTESRRCVTTGRKNTSRAGVNEIKARLLLRGGGEITQKLAAKTVFAQSQRTTQRRRRKTRRSRFNLDAQSADCRLCERVGTWRQLQHRGQLLASAAGTAPSSVGGGHCTHL